MCQHSIDPREERLSEAGSLAAYHLFMDSTLYIFANLLTLATKVGIATKKADK